MTGSHSSDGSGFFTGASSTGLADLVNQSRPMATATVWQPTQPMRAVSAEARPEPCRCDYHKYGHPPGAGIVLYTRPGGEWLRWEAHIRDGLYEDVAAYGAAAAHEIRAAFDAVATRSERRFESIARRISAAGGAA